MPEMTSSSGDEGVHARIRAAAREEFASRGEAAASVHAIARRAGVTAAMINYYFGGKRALYEALVAEAQERLHATLVAALAGDPKDRAGRLAGAYFDFLVEEADMQRLLLREVIDDARRSAALVRPLRAILEAEFGADDEVRQRALTVFGAIAAYFIYAPLLGELTDDPLGADALARRRAHVVQLARTMGAWPC